MGEAGRVQSAVCIKCGGDKDLMDRGMAPGMTYCRPCRVQMSREEAVLDAMASCQDCICDEPHVCPALGMDR